MVGWCNKLVSEMHFLQGKKMASSLAGQAQEQVRRALAAREKAARGGDKKH